MPAPPRQLRAVIVAVVAVVEVEVAPAGTTLLTTAPSRCASAEHELIARAADELARRVVALHDQHHAVGSRASTTASVTGSTGRRVEDDEVVLLARSSSSVARMRAEPTSSAGFGGVGPAGMNEIVGVSRTRTIAPSSTWPARKLDRPAVVLDAEGAMAARMAQVDVDEQHARARLGERRRRGSGSSRSCPRSPRAGDQDHLRRRRSASRTAPRCGACGTPPRPASAARASPRAARVVPVAERAPAPLVTRVAVRGAAREREVRDGRERWAAAAAPPPPRCSSRCCRSTRTRTWRRRRRRGRRAARAPG